MLDRRTVLIVSAFVGVMMATAVWLVGDTSRWLPGPFVAPACVMFVLGVLQWRLARAEGDLSAWRKWGGCLVISYAAICALFQVTLVLTILKMIALPASSVARGSPARWLERR